MKVSAERSVKILLELSEYEAAVLKTLLGNVGGPISGHRKVTDTMYEKLHALVIDGPPVSSIYDEGSVYLK